MSKGTVSTVAFGGKMTPEQTLLNAQQRNEEHAFQRVIVVAVDRDGDVHLSTSSGNGLEHVGLLEIAVDNIISTMAFRSMQKEQN